MTELRSAPSGMPEERRTGMEAAMVMCAEVLGLPAVDPSDNFLDLGGDSFSAIELSAQLSKLCDCEVTVEDLFIIETFSELLGPKL